VSHRPLVLVSGLTLGDYLLWNWSLSANQDVLALISGLTLPALAIAFIWLLMLDLGRLLARAGRRSREPVGERRRRVAPGDAHGGRGESVFGRHAPAVSPAPEEDAAAARDSSATSPGKLAA